MSSYTLPEDITKQIIANCRLHKVTFGNALLVCGQVALSRVLHRQYALGNLSRDEWMRRRKEPYHVGGPLNIRPFLDANWFKNGGASELALNIGIFMYSLPFLPLAGADTGPMDISDGAPSFANLLSLGRFIHRTNILQRQAEAFLKHPLFLDFVSLYIAPNLQHNKDVFEKWSEGPCVSDIGGVGAEKQPDGSLVFAHGGSSMGNVSWFSS